MYYLQNQHRLSLRLGAGSTCPEPRGSNFLLEKLGLQRINADHSIFVTSAGINGPIVSTFVDDIKIMGAKNSGVIGRVKKELTATFDMVDMGPISFYLGLKVSRDRERMIKLSQPAYIDKIRGPNTLVGA